MAAVGEWLRNNGLCSCDSPMGYVTETEAAWAWLGDMELDDVLLGLGAASILPGSSPLAIGFLVNAFHCAEKGPSTLTASEMYHEKRTFLDTFFGSTFFAVLDRYDSAGPKSRGWVGSLTAEQLGSLEDACGLTDEFQAWMDRVASARPKMLHLLISGPLLGRGEELCKALGERILSPRADGVLPEVVIWTYAGSFNLAHSSEQDFNCLKNLVANFSPRVSVVETTLKSGAWVGEPRMFWNTACPTAWTVEDAKRNPVGFNMSTDIQGANSFFESYSSQLAGEPRRGLKWIFEKIATGRMESGSPEGAEVVLKLLRELEVRSLTTNLTKMVGPDSSSMAKSREALSQSGGANAQQLEETYKRAVGLVTALRDVSGNNQSAAAASVDAAKEYAQLYSGSTGEFLEIGCTEYFPKGMPFCGPRLDKRSMIRCMAQGVLQGGPLADVLVLLALLLHLERLDPRATSHRASAKSTPGESVPAETRKLFRLEESSLEGCPPRCFSTDLAPGIEMGEQTRAGLAPLIDAAITAVISGAGRLHMAASAAPWGTRHSAGRR